MWLYYSSKSISICYNIAGNNYTENVNKDRNADDNFICSAIAGSKGEKKDYINNISIACINKKDDFSDKSSIVTANTFCENI